MKTYKIELEENTYLVTAGIAEAGEIRTTVMCFFAGEYCGEYSEVWEHAALLALCNHAPNKALKAVANLAVGLVLSLNGA